MAASLTVLASSFVQKSLIDYFNTNQYKLTENDVQPKPDITSFPKKVDKVRVQYGNERQVLADSVSSRFLEADFMRYTIKRRRSFLVINLMRIFKNTLSV